MTSVGPLNDYTVIYHYLLVFLACQRNVTGQRKMRYSRHGHGNEWNIYPLQKLKLNVLWRKKYCPVNQSIILKTLNTLVPLGRMCYYYRQVRAKKDLTSTKETETERNELVAKWWTLISELQGARKGVRRKKKKGGGGWWSRVFVWLAGESGNLGICLCSPF